MKSIKPGRGPSMHNAVGSIFMVIFGVIWTLVAVGMTWDAGIIGFLFPLFGLVFIGQGIYSAVVSFKNAKGKDRMSLYDIVDESEEKDPWDPDYNPDEHATYSNPSTKTGGNFCPYCGQPVEKDHKFCKNCGKPLN